MNTGGKGAAALRRVVFNAAFIRMSQLKAFLGKKKSFFFNYFHSSETPDFIGDLFQSPFSAYQPRCRAAAGFE